MARFSCSQRPSVDAAAQFCPGSTRVRASGLAWLAQHGSSAASATGSHQRSCTGGATRSPTSSISFVGSRSALTRQCATGLCQGTGVVWGAGLVCTGRKVQGMSATLRARRCCRCLLCPGATCVAGPGFAASVISPLAPS